MAADAERPKPLVIPPSQVHTCTIIVLHGLTTDGIRFGADFLKTALDSDKRTLPQAFPHAKFVFPSGSPRRCTAFDGKMTHAWFDISSIADRTIGESKQIEGLQENTEYLSKLIRAEIAVLELLGRRKENVALWGFSQGCAMGIWVLLNQSLKLGAFVGMSGWLPFRRQISEAVEREEDLNLQRVRALDLMSDLVPVPSLHTGPASERLACFATPVFLGHGLQDVKVRTEWGEEMRDALRILGMNIAWKGYDGLEHGYKVPDEIEDVSKLLRGRGFQFPRLEGTPQGTATD